MSISRKLFDKTPDGREVYAYTMKNAAGMSAKVLSFGGILNELNVPDKDGKTADVISGFDTVADYINGGGYQGALIGRVGNRIGGATCVIDGKKYDFFKNDGPNTLHGGKEGFNLKIWSVCAKETDEYDALILNYVSEDGEENYPGTLDVTVTYTLKPDNSLAINYKATTDKTTIVNLTNHSYFNLTGFNSGKSVHGHTLELDADYVSDIDSGLIPTGTDIDVTGTPFDFRTAKEIGKDIAADDRLIKLGGGYDHNFVLKPDGSCKYFATLTDPESGRSMKVYTTEPCVQIYTANMVNEHGCAFKGGFPQKKRCGVCIETQHKPDSINHLDGTVFTDVILTPDRTYDTTTVFKF